MLPKSITITSRRRREPHGHPESFQNLPKTSPRHNFGQFFKKFGSFVTKVRKHSGHIFESASANEKKQRLQTQTLGCLKESFGKWCVLHDSGSVFTYEADSLRNAGLRYKTGPIALFLKTRVRCDETSYLYIQKHNGYGVKPALQHCIALNTSVTV